MRGFALALAASLCACDARSGRLPAPFALALPADGAIVALEELSFSWSASDHHDRFTWSLTPGSAVELAPGATQWQPGEPLEPGKPYQWQVVATGPAGDTPAANGPFTFTLAPPPLAAFRALAPTADAPAVPLQPTFDWEPALGAARYALEVTRDGEVAYVNEALAPGTARFVLPVKLEPSTRYAWTITAIDSVRRTAAGNAPLAFETAALPAPFQLLGPAHGATGVPVLPELKWSDATGEDDYTLELGDTPRVELPRDTTRWVPPSPLAALTLYSWRVLARNVQGTREVAGSFTTGGLPGGFVLLSPLPGAHDAPIRAQLAWSPSAGADSYRVQVATEPSFTPPLVFEQAGIGTTSVTPPMTLSNLTRYRWRVIATNAAGATTAQGEFFTAMPLGVPQLFNPVDGDTGVMVLAGFYWQPPFGASTQVVEVATDAAFANVAHRSPPLAATGFLYSMATPLLPVTRYWWRVTADGAGGTAVSAARSFTTGITPSAFVQLTPLNGATAVSNTPAFSWTDAMNEIEYRVEVSGDAQFSGELAVRLQLSADTTSAAIDTCPLARGRTWWWRVIAVGPGGDTVASGAPFSFTTITTAPGGGLEWAVGGATFDTFGLAPMLVADSSHLYTAMLEGEELRVQKRRKSDASLVWQAASPAVLGPEALALDGTGVYVGSRALDTQFRTIIRLEKHDLATGAAVTSFGDGGMVLSDPTPGDDVIAALAVDATSIYLAGSGAFSPSQRHEWYLAKLDKLTGQHDPLFGNGGGMLIPQGAFDDRARSLALAGSTLLVAGWTATSFTDRAWKLEARQLSDGALVPSFGLAGAVRVNPGTVFDEPSAVVVDANDLYFAGTDRSFGTFDGQWRVEKRNVVDGQPIASFGDGGVLLSNPGASDDRLAHLAVDANRLYLAGRGGDVFYDRWRVEAWGKGSGTIDPTWGAAGVVECGWRGAEVALSVVVDADAVFVLGASQDMVLGSLGWRLERREK